MGTGLGPEEVHHCPAGSGGRSAMDAREPPEGTTPDSDATPGSPTPAGGVPDH